MVHYWLVWLWEYPTPHFTEIQMGRLLLIRVMSLENAVVFADVSAIGLMGLERTLATVGPKQKQTLHTPIDPRLKVSLPVCCHLLCPSQKSDNICLWVEFYAIRNPKRELLMSIFIWTGFTLWCAMQRNTSMFSHCSVPIRTVHL